MTHLYKLLLAIGMTIMSTFAWGTEVQDHPITLEHQALVSESDWLNTARALKEDDLKGRILLLDFWTFCCINCIHIIPDLHYLEKKFGNDLTVVGVHSAKFANEKDTENIRSAVLRYDIEHPVVNDANFRIWRTFGVSAWPTLVLISPDGKIAQMYSGEGNRDRIEKDVEALRKKYAGQFINTPLALELEKNKAPKSILNFPGKVTYAPAAYEGKDVLFIADSNHHRIVGINLHGDIVLHIGSGQEGKNDGGFEQAQFNKPQGMVYKDNILYVADTENHLLRKIDLSAKTVSTIAGTGVQGYERFANNQDALTTPLASPWDIAFYPDDKHLAIAMAGTHQLWTYDIDKKTVSVLAGNGRESIDDGSYPLNSLSQPSGLSAYNGKLYFVDSETSSLRVLEDGKITTLIGTGLFNFGFKDGKQGAALLQHPLGIYADKTGIYVADSYNHSIRHYDPATKTLTTYAGQGIRGSHNGKLNNSSFNEPNGITRVGDILYVTDTNNHALRAIDTKEGHVSNILVMVSSSPTTATVAEFLPGVVPSASLDVTAGTPVTLSLGLKEGWKINKDAPTFLNLFEQTATGYTPIQQWDREALESKQVNLPSLAEGKTYRLQGTFYYCEDKEGALCLIQSYDQVLHAKQNSQQNTIVVNLKTSG